MVDRKLSEHEDRHGLQESLDYGLFLLDLTPNIVAEAYLPALFTTAIGRPGSLSFGHLDGMAQETGEMAEVDSSFVRLTRKSCYYGVAAFSTLLHDCLP